MWMYRSSPPGRNSTGGRASGRGITANTSRFLYLTQAPTWSTLLRRWGKGWWVSTIWGDRMGSTELLKYWTQNFCSEASSSP